MNQWKVSILIPILRPEGAYRCVKALECEGPYEFEIIWEEDKDRIGCPKMLKRLVEKSQYDWVMFLGDDTIPQTGMILRAFEASEGLPNGWGMVGLNDGFHDGNLLATHWMAHKKLLPLLGGEFFHTGYRHTYCDVELTQRCKEMGRYIFAENAKLIHDHPILKNEKLTGDYARVYNEENQRHDLILFRRRERDGWL